MHIGEFSDSFLPIIDGVGRVVKAYAYTLAERGNEVYVICPMDKMGFRGNYPFDVVEYNSHQLSKTLPWKVGIDRSDAHFINRMKMIDLDICHSHTPLFAGHSALAFAKKRRIPLVSTFHSKYYDDIIVATHSKLLARLGTDYIVNYYNKCDEVWAVSEASAETLKSYGYKREVVVMPNGTDRHTLITERIPEVISKYKLNKEKPILLFVGQINFKKNLQRIIEGCALLKKGGLDFQLVMAGTGPDVDKIKKLANALGIKGNLIMTGHLQDAQVLDCLYYVSDMFVFPSIYDNAPMVVREAAAMSTCALLIEGSSAAEIVKDGVNGILCKDNSEDFADKVRKFLALSPEKRKSIEKNAEQTIPIRWDGPIMDAVIDRYKYLIEKHNSKRGINRL